MQRRHGVLAAVYGTLSTDVDNWHACMAAKWRSMSDSRKRKLEDAQLEDSPPPPPKAFSDVLQ